MISTDNLSILFFGIVLGAMMLIYTMRFYDRKKKQYIQYRARKGEYEAEQLLEQNGYTIIATQEKRPITIYLNNEPVVSYVKADLIVEKKGRIYLAEIKTGNEANPRLPRVRRQLLEYQTIFNVD